MFKALIARWSRNRRGSVAIMFALALPVMIFGIGFAVDYGLYAREKARLNMMADEAVLAAVSSTAMTQTTAQAQTLAQNMFTAQASQLPRVTFAAGQPHVSISMDASDVIRTVSVTYTGTYSTIFSSVLGIPTLPVSGQSVAESASPNAPNTNFYVLLDNQGSMALPASQAGIAQMQTLTPLQLSGGCAFACHEAAPNNPAPGFASDVQGNPCQSGTHGSNCPQIDNYQLARNNNIPLRFDEVTSAISALISTASSLQGEMSPQPTYQFSVYSVDSPYTQGLYNVMPLTAQYVTNWSNDSSNLQLYTVYSDGGACATSGSNKCGTYADTASQVSPTMIFQNVGFFSSPMGTEMSTLASAIPAAGTGASGSTPKEVLLVVTDGVEDTVVSNQLSITTWDSSALSACTTMKNNGVKIAILYTTYYPTAGFWLYDDYVANFQSNIGPTLQGCASPGLFMTAAVGDNLTTDFITLFQLAMQSSRLTQ
ncbi:TadE/TadG family type IV pilus assembly protein [Methylocapsa sp. S129]|uniref:TadE/TadG family type IV pilus assembly protein n=1 Tax=Methylocapsa sp. S129 TaxID=1641869 RepID=UPI00131C0588|nr:TadE/TadG family type IV pilus assembly protein [Methylocapsa sp. S129]